MPTKKTTTKAKRSRASAKAAATKRRQITLTVSGHHYPPQTQVAVRETRHVPELDRSAKREPTAKPLSTETVGKDGSLEITVPKKGSYAVTGQVGDEYLTMLVGVK